MKNLTSKLLGLLLTVSVIFSANAQFETTMPNMRSLYQSSYINPAFTPEFKFSLGLPVINNLGMQFNLTGIDLNTIAKSIDKETETDASGNAVTVNYLNFTKLFKNMDDALGFNIPMQFDILYLRFPIKGYYFGINSTMKLENSFGVTKEFLGFLTSGNLPAIGQVQNFEMLKTSINSYTEFGLSLSKDYKRFSFGVRAKYLKGIANIRTENIKFIVNTQNQIPYPIEINVSGNIHSAGVGVLTDADTLTNGSILTADEKNPKTSLTNSLSAKGNDGWAFDIGIGYQLSPRINIFASAIDLGAKINWNTSVYNYKLDESKIGFNGLSYNQAVNGSGGLVDSLTSKFGTSSVIRDTVGYTSLIPTKYYAGIDYDLSLRDRVTLLFQGIDDPNQKKFYQAYTISYNHRFFRALNITGNYSLKDFTRNDIGFGMSMKFGPLQYYFMADNLITLVNPSIARNLYFRMGFNLVLGRNVKVKKMFL